MTWSPGERFFFFTTHHAEMGSDSTVVGLHVYSAEAVQAQLRFDEGQRSQAVEPIVRIERQAPSELAAIPAIRGASWEADGKSVLFAGMTNQGVMQVHRLHVPSGKLEQLTAHPAGVTDFHARGNGFLFKTEVRVPFEYRYPASVFTQPAGSALEWTSDRIRERTLVVYEGRAPKTLSQTYQNVFYRREWMSPDGRFAIGRYDGSIEGSAKHRKSLDALNAQLFVVVDLQRGVFLTPALQFGYQVIPGTQHYITPQVFWFSDSTHAVLSAAVPKGFATLKHGQTSYIMEYKVEAGEWRILEPHFEPPASGDSQSAPRKYVTGMGWLKEGEELLVTHNVDGKAGQGTVYSVTRMGVVGRTVDSAVTFEKEPSKVAPESLSVELRQAANDPPQIVASAGQAEIDLLGPDSALNGVRLARSEPFRWNESGETITGGLTLPPDFTSGLRVPVVVLAQSRPYLPQVFLPDGQVTTGSAARQALAARGIAVLELDFGALKGEQFVARLDAAVGALVRAGIADPERVGISGFSWGGYMAYYSVTHPRETRIAAAVCSDSHRGEYSEYLINGMFGSTAPYVVHIEEQMGGQPFWRNKSAWLEKETSFNVDRVRGATLFTLHGGIFPSSIRSHFPGIGTIGAFVLNRKPVEYLYFPKGDHQLQRPRERLAMMEATVDWMTFWLQGYEDPAPHKAAQYTRWRAMRDRRDESRS